MHRYNDVWCRARNVCRGLTCCSVFNTAAVGEIVGPQSRSRSCSVRPLKTFTPRPPTLDVPQPPIRPCARVTRPDVTSPQSARGCRATGRRGVAPRDRPAGRNDADPHPRVDTVANLRTFASRPCHRAHSEYYHHGQMLYTRQSALRVGRMYAC